MLIYISPLQEDSSEVHPTQLYKTTIKQNDLHPLAKQRTKKEKQLISQISDFTILSKLDYKSLSFSDFEYLSAVEIKLRM